MTAYGLRLPDLGGGGEDTGSVAVPSGGPVLGLAPGSVGGRLVALARAAEEAGFRSLWVKDRPHRRLPALGATRPAIEAYTLLGTLAAVTSRATLGALATGVVQRNPAVLAKQVTTLDVVCEGRAVLGVGMGADGEGIAERLERLEEAVRICKAMLTEESPSFEGRHYTIHEASNRPRPVRGGGPPVLVSGSDHGGSLRIAARYGDMCNVTGSPEAVHAHLQALDRHCARLSRDPSEITKSRLGALRLTGTRKEADRLAAELRAPIGDESLAEHYTIGDADHVAEQVLALADTGLDELIFDLPAAASAEEVSNAGAVLSRALG